MRKIVLLSLIGLFLIPLVNAACSGNGDFNRDGRVNEGDRQIMLDCFNKACSRSSGSCSVSECNAADMERSGRVDFSDFLCFTQHYNKGCSRRRGCSDDNDDGRVDFSDLMSFAGCFDRGSGGSCSNFDFDNNGRVDDLDYYCFSSDYGKAASCGDGRKATLNYCASSCGDYDGCTCPSTCNNQNINRNENCGGEKQDSGGSTKPAGDGNKDQLGGCSQTCNDADGCNCPNNCHKGGSIDNGQNCGGAISQPPRGQCGTTEYTCSVGSVTSRQASSSQWRWKCRADGGESGWCSKNKGSGSSGGGSGISTSGDFFVGCFRDQASRALTAEFGETSLEECQRRVEARGLPFFGMQYPQGDGNRNTAQCFGGTTPDRYGSLSCSNRKNSNGQYMGDGWQNAVYRTSGSSTSTDTGGDFFIGCFNDRSSRALSANMGGQRSLEQCQQFARSRNLQFFAMQYPEGNRNNNNAECFAGNSGYDRYGSKSCTNNKNGNGLHMGSGWENAVYRTSGSPEPSCTPSHVNNCDSTDGCGNTRPAISGYNSCDLTSSPTCGLEGNRCDGIDNNCDGVVDNVLSSPNANKQAGVCANAKKVCTSGSWREPTYSSIPNYRTTEICDGLDNDCDGQVDEGLSAPLSNNQNGVCKDVKKVCAGASGWQEPDYSQVQGYSASDQCDGIDNDCDGSVDEDGATTYYRDADNDNYGGQQSLQSCEDVPGYVTNNRDCNDGNNQINPGAAEVCDAIDWNCDGRNSDDLTREVTCGVGQCAQTTGMQMCENGVWATSDCDPYAQATAEICDNVDNDCDGINNEELTPEPADRNQGICIGLTKSCGTSGWLEPFYSQLPDFEDSEVSCSDGIDNDCDGFEDDNDDDCLVDSISINPINAQMSEQDTTTYQVTLNNKDGTSQDITQLSGYRVDKPTIGQFAGNVLTAIGQGSSLITIRYETPSMLKEKSGDIVVDFRDDDSDGIPDNLETPECATESADNMPPNTTCLTTLAMGDDPGQESYGCWIQSVNPGADCGLTTEYRCSDDSSKIEKRTFASQCDDLGQCSVQLIDQATYTDDTVCSQLTRCDGPEGFAERGQFSCKCINDADNDGICESVGSIEGDDQCPDENQLTEKQFPEGISELCNQWLFNTETGCYEFEHINQLTQVREEVCQQANCLEPNNIVKYQCNRAGAEIVDGKTCQQMQQDCQGDPDGSVEACALYMEVNHNKAPEDILCTEFDEYCWSQYDSGGIGEGTYCCGDDGESECWMDSDGNGCCASNSLGRVAYITDADDSAPLCQMLGQQILSKNAGVCDKAGEQYCWDTRTASCCGDDPQETWEYSTSRSLGDILVDQTCIDGKWVVTFERDTTYYDIWSQISSLFQ